MSGAIDPLLASGNEALEAGDWATARSAFEWAIEQEETAEALFGLGDALWWLGDIERSICCRERAKPLSGDSIRPARSWSRSGFA